MAGRNPLLLYMGDAHDLVGNVLTAWLDSVKTEDGFLIQLAGSGIATAEEFFDACRRSIPGASYMGSNLDALEDIFRCEALSPDENRRTYWLWKDAHVMYKSEQEAFKRVFESLAYCAKEVRHGSKAIPAKQPVTLVLTARHDVLGDESQKSDSFLYHFTFASNAFGDDATNCEVLTLGD